MPQPAPTPAALGSAIRAAREAAGLTRVDLAAAAHIHRNYLAGLEVGARNPTLEVLTRVSAALHVPLSDLVNTAERLDSKAR